MRQDYRCKKKKKKKTGRGLVKGGLKFKDFLSEMVGIHFEEECIFWELIIHHCVVEMRTTWNIGAVRVVQ